MSHKIQSKWILFAFLLFVSSISNSGEVGDEIPSKNCDGIVAFTTQAPSDEINPRTVIFWVQVNIDQNGDVREANIIDRKAPAIKLREIQLLERAVLDKINRCTFPPPSVESLKDATRYVRYVFNLH